MSGQSITDRVIAAKHSIAGQGLAKSVCKATTEEVMGPKKKHLDYLLQCTNEPNVSIPQLADLLITRTQHQNWVTVFKSLITIHNLMNFGNERFTQYLASNNCKFNLSGFLDKAGVAGYDMSTFIRRYAKYLNEKSYSYRMMAFDFCKVKRGKEDGMLRTMNGEKLLKTLPILQSQLDALLEFDCTANELTNGVINACFMLIFKDLIRLFACYNDGIINLLEKYFEMNKKQCKEALDLYKKFLVRMDKVSEFLKTAENVGIDKGDIPDLAKAPSSLLDALEQHLASLESTKKSGAPPSKPKGVQSAIQSFANGRGQITEEEKRKVLEEEQMRLNQLKTEEEAGEGEAKMREAQAAAGSPVSQPPAPIITQQQQPNLFGSPTNSVPAPVAAPAAQPASLNNANTTTTTSSNIDFFAAPPAQVQLAAPTQQPAQQQQSVVVAPAQPAPAKPMDDLLSLSGTSAFSENIMANQPTPGGATNAFQPVSTPAAVVLSPVAPVAPVANILSPGDQWSPPPAATGTSNNTSGSFSADFAAVFGNTEPAGPGSGGVTLTPTAVLNQPPPGFDGFGEVLQPKGNQGMARGTQAKDEKLIKGNLDESLASLAGNLNIKSPAHQVKKQQHQWKPSERNQKTGGANWNAPTISSATSWGGQPPVYQTGGSTQPPMTTMSSGMGMGQPGVMGMQQQRPMGMGMGIGVQQPMGAMAGQPHQQQNMFQQPLSQTQQQPSPADDPFGSL